MAGLNVTAVGVIPVLFFKPSIPFSLSVRLPSISPNVLLVAPLASSLPSPLYPYGVTGSSISDFLSCSGSLGSTLTSSTIPSGNSVGSTVRGNLLLENIIDSSC